MAAYKIDPYEYGFGTGSGCQPKPSRSQQLEMSIQAFAREQCARGKSPREAFEDAEEFFQIAGDRAEDVNYNEGEEHKP